MPLVTIITITFNIIKNNRLKFIKQNFESVHNQTYPNIEHIIIDGASNDGTIELLNDYQNKGYIKYYSEPDKGVYFAMNKGIDKANGKYIAFMNSDDFYNNPDAILASVLELEKTNADASYGDTQGIYHVNDKKLDIWKGDINEMPFGRHFCHQSMFTKKDVLKELGGFDTSYKISSDSDIIIRLVSKGYKLIHIEKIIASYRTGGLSQQKTELVRKEHSQAFYEHMGKDMGLSRDECFEIWNYRVFEEKDFDYCVRLGTKLKNEEWMIRYFRFLSNPVLNRSNRYCSDREWKLIEIERKLIKTFFRSGSLQRKILSKIVRLVH